MNASLPSEELVVPTSLIRRVLGWWMPILCGLWFAAVVSGMALLWRYKSTPGEPASRAPATWPEASRLSRTPGRATILVFAHPKCPCTRASIDELAVLMTQVGTVADARVTFFKPPATPDGWENTDTRRRAGELPGVDVVIDADGTEAASFGAKTSGETLVYDAQGKLLFHGGITSARGHAGDSSGRRRITELLLRGSTDKTTAPTFGCGFEERGKQ